MSKIPSSLRKNPSAAHVQRYDVFRLRRGKPKAALPSTRGESLTIQRFSKLLEVEERNLLDSWRGLQEYFVDLNREYRATSNDARRKELLVQLDRMAPQISAYPSSLRGYPILQEMIRDFRRIKNLRIVEFGSGYGLMGFFLQKFLRAKYVGVEKETFGKSFSRRKGLQIIHGTGAESPAIGRLGQFDISLSMGLLENKVAHAEQLRAIVENLAKVTRKGGKSYHLVYTPEDLGVTKDDFERNGFSVDAWESIVDPSNQRKILFLKLTKTG